MDRGRRWGEEGEWGEHRGEESLQKACLLREMRGCGGVGGDEAEMEGDLVSGIVYGLGLDPDASLPRCVVLEAGLEAEILEGVGDACHDCVRVAAVALGTLTRKDFYGGHARCEGRRNPFGVLGVRVVTGVGVIVG